MSVCVCVCVCVGSVCVKVTVLRKYRSWYTDCSVQVYKLKKNQTYI